MKKYISRQVLMMIPTLFIVTVLAFAMIRLMPAGAVDAYILSHHMDRTEESEEIVREMLGLNEPVVRQYIHWIGNVLRLDFGQSYSTQQDVGKMLWNAFLATLRLSLASMVWIAVLTPLLGIGAARHPGSALDSFARIFCLAGTAVPAFVLGFFLIRLFGVQLKILPVTGNTSWTSYIMPSFTLSLSHIAYFVQMLRNEMLENRKTPCVLYARARGIDEDTIFNTHLLANSILPVVDTVGISVGSLIAGTVVIENVFSWPGLGQVITTAILARDYPVIQGYVLVVAIVFMVANMLSDLLGAVVDPRIRLGENAK